MHSWKIQRGKKKEKQKEEQNEKEQQTEREKEKEKEKEKEEAEETNKQKDKERRICTSKFLVSQFFFCVHAPTNRTLETSVVSLTVAPFFI